MIVVDSEMRSVPNRQHGRRQLHGRQAVRFITSLHNKSMFIYDRNAAKARTRDAIGRLQKGFFGRRRLEMLSKGLVGQGQEKTLSTSTSKDLEYNPPVVTIDLAHAKRNIQLPLRGKLISTATRHPLHTSVQRESDVSNKTGNAHGGFRSSKVLNALDVSDRACK